jgi:N-acyl-D-amino-acid deacylase
MSKNKRLSALQALYYHRLTGMQQHKFNIIFCEAANLSPQISLLSSPCRWLLWHMRINRRRFFRQSGLAAAAFTANASFASRVRGAPGRPMDQAFDDAVNSYMKPRKTPGAALAVIKDRRLVYARAYGWADVEKKEAPRPNSLFRIASLSKPFTAVAVLKLVAAGRLQMDAPAFDILQLEPLSGPKPDPRLKRITVRHLLHHTGGWDRDKSGDPMFMSEKIARANGQPPPANQRAIIRYMLGQPLDFDPGARYAYSNFGYCVLGRIIEKISSLNYAAWVQQDVLAPIGIRRMRQGISSVGGRAEGEVKYYMPDRGLSGGATNTEPYTGFCLEAMDSHGGWLASAVDLGRFAAALDDPARASWLSPKTRRVLDEPPAPPASRKPDGSLQPFYYACGWMVRPVARTGRANYWHTGSLPGTFTLLIRRYDGLAWAILFNQRSSDSKLPDGEIDGALHQAADSVAEWPEHDLFGNYS